MAHGPRRARKTAAAALCPALLLQALGSAAAPGAAKALPARARACLPGLPARTSLDVVPTLPPSVSPSAPQAAPLPPASQPSAFPSLRLMAEDAAAPADEARDPAAGKERAGLAFDAATPSLASAAGMTLALDESSPGNGPRLSASSPRGPPAGARGAGPWSWALKQWRDAKGLVGKREVRSPGLLSMAAATLALAAFPWSGATALHEFGHYVMIRLLGGRVRAVRLHYEGGGYVAQALPIRGPLPSSQLAVSLAGPAFSVLHAVLALGAVTLSAGLMLPDGGALSFPSFMSGFAGAAYFGTVFLLDVLHAGGWEGDLAKVRAAWRELVRSPRRTILLSPGVEAWLAELSARLGIERDRVLADALALLACAGDFVPRGSRLALKGGRRALTLDLAARPLRPRGSATLATLRLSPPARRAIDALKARFGWRWSLEAVMASLLLLDAALRLGAAGRPVRLRDGARALPLEAGVLQSRSLGRRGLGRIPYDF